MKKKKLQSYSQITMLTICIFGQFSFYKYFNNFQKPQFHPMLFNNNKNIHGISDFHIAVSHSKGKVHFSTIFFFLENILMHFLIGVKNIFSYFKYIITIYMHVYCRKGFIFNDKMIFLFSVGVVCI